MKIRKGCIKLLKRAKDNLGLLVILPAVLGGIWQIFSLGNISLSFIRFFSVTQVIADGMLLIALFATLYLAFYLSSLMLRRPDEEQERTWSLRRSIALTLLTVPLLIPSIMMLRDVYSDPGAIGLVYLLVALGSFFLWIRLFFSGLFQCVLILLDRKSSIREWIQARSEGISLAAAFVALVVLAGIANAGLDLLTRAGGWSVDPRNIGNWGNVDRIVRERFPTFSRSEVLYHNDSYIFVRLENEQSEGASNKIVILEFEELFAWPHGSPKTAEPQVPQPEPQAPQPEPNNSEQDGADQPATAPESKPEGDSKPQPESEGRSQ